MSDRSWLRGTSPAFRLMIATSWLSPAHWQDKQEQAIREAFCAGLDWMEYLRLVDRHRTPALSWAALGRVRGLEIPEPARQELQKRSDACRMHAIRHSLKLAEVLKSFNRAGIPVMTFKGPILSSYLYGDVGLRQFKDVDLAVTQENLTRAQTCLESLGWGLYSTYFPLSPRQWESFLRHEHHLGFVHSQGGWVLELHWRNLWDTPGQATAKWARNVASVWQGCSYQTMNPIDMVLYLCIHGANHGWFRAKWMGDMARIHAEGRVDWEAVLGEARRAGQERALLASLYLLDQVYGLPLPGLPGNPWKDLPSLLIEVPLHNLKDPDEPAITVSVITIPRWLQKSRYERLLLPQKAWRDSLFLLWYRREDFRTLHLPDSLFWAYAPLRPISCVWRWVRRNWPIRAGRARNLAPRSNKLQ